MSDSTPLTISERTVFVAVIRRAVPRLVEAALVPTALFCCAVVLVGVGAA